MIKLLRVSKGQLLPNGLMRLQRLPLTLNIIMLTKETNLLTGPSLQADFSWQTILILTLQSVD